MGRAPLSISVTPLKVTLPEGVHQATEHVTVTNTGTAAFTVHAVPMDVLAVKGGCGVAPAAGSQMTISHLGTLQPGQSKQATVSVHVPAGINVDVAAVFEAGPAVQSGASGGHAGAGIGSQVIVQGRGISTAPVCSRHHQVAASHGDTGLGPLFVVGMIAAVLAAVACLTVMRLRRHRRT